MIGMLFSFTINHIKSILGIHPMVFVLCGDYSKCMETVKIQHKNA